MGAECGFLLDQPYVRRQAARLAEHSVTVGARVVPALLVHRVHVPRQMARLPERSGAVGARVVPALLHRMLGLLHHPALVKRQEFYA